MAIVKRPRVKKDTHSTAKEKIDNAIRWVAQWEPIAVPTVLTRWEVIEDYSVGTLATNGRMLKYNPDFVDCLSTNATRAIILHEVGHVLAQHQHRLRGRDKKLFNIAADLALNGMLYRGYTLAYNNNSSQLFDELVDPTSPTSGCFAGMGRFSHFDTYLDAEAYYELLKDEKNKMNNVGNGKGEGDEGEGGGIPIPTPTPSAEGQQQQQQQQQPSPLAPLEDVTKTFGGGIESAVDESEYNDEEGDEQAALLQRGDGQNLVLETVLNHIGAGEAYSPLGLGRIISGVKATLIGDPDKAANINWRVVLEEFLAKAHTATPSYQRPNRRLHTLGKTMGVLFPAKHGKSKTNGAVIVDTSASMGDKDCEQAIVHIGSILSSFPASTVNMIQCDTGVRCSEEYTGGDFPPTDWKGWMGRGGTDLSPALSFVKDNQDDFDWVIVVTDGEFYRWKLVDPSIPVLWIHTRNSKSYWATLAYPFGTVVGMKATA